MASIPTKPHIGTSTAILKSSNIWGQSLSRRHIPSPLWALHGDPSSRTTPASTIWQQLIMSNVPNNTSFIIASTIDIFGEQKVFTIPIWSFGDQSDPVVWSGKEYRSLSTLDLAIESSNTNEATKLTELRSLIVFDIYIARFYAHFLWINAGKDVNIIIKSTHYCVNVVKHVIIIQCEFLNKSTMILFQCIEKPNDPCTFELRLYRCQNNWSNDQRESKQYDHTSNIWRKKKFMKKTSWSSSHSIYSPYFHFISYMHL